MGDQVRKRIQYCNYALGYLFRTKILRQRIPFIGGLVINEKCNLRCKHCDVANKNIPDLSYEDIKKGREHFNIFCSNCHGLQGKGDGYLFSSGLFPAKPTSLVEARVKSMPDGEVYYVITMGSMSGLMGPHGSQVPPDDRWAIIHYVRELGK